MFERILGEQGEKMTKLKNKEVYFDKKDIIAFAVMLISFLVLLQYRNYIPFLDESDNFLGGQIVSTGGLIYKDFVSQHMPGMYYICALIIKLGITGIANIRTFFYVLIFISWIAMYLRYRNLFSRWVIPAYTVFYLGMVSDSKGYTILAEQVEISAVVIIVCELMLFYKIKKLSLSSGIIIAVSCWLSIACTFTSIWAMACLALMFIANYIIRWKNGEDVKRGLTEIIRTGIMILIPFAIWIIYMWKTGTISEWFYQSYKFNQEVYSKYNNFSGILNTIIQPFFGYGYMIWNAVQEMATQVYASIIVLLYAVVNILFCFEMGKKKKIYGILMFVFIMAVGSRSFGSSVSDFKIHGTPYLAVTGFMLAYLLFEVWDRTKVSIVFVAVLALIPIADSMHDVSAYVAKQKEEKPSYTKQYIDLITEKNEKVYFVNFNGDVDYVEYQRLPAARLVHVHPWFMEIFQQDIVDDLKTNTPRVITYDETFTIWGYNVNEYASILRNYIYQNYEQIGKEEANVWVRNDYYEEAVSIINNEDKWINENDEWIEESVSISNNFASVTFVPQVNKLNEIQIYTTVSGDVRSGYYMIDVYKDDTGECIYSGAVPVEGILDGWQIFSLDDVKVTPGQQYKIQIMTDDIPEQCEVQLYFNRNDLESVAYLNKVKQDKAFAIRIYGE